MFISFDKNFSYVFYMFIYDLITFSFHQAILSIGTVKVARGKLDRGVRMMSPYT